MTAVYTRGQPVGTDFLSVSQPYLAQNTNSSDSVFGFDHFAFSNNTMNQGFHQKVTTPLFSVETQVGEPNFSPPTTTTNPIMYGYTPLNTSGTPTTSLPVIQWSRAPGDAVPNPITWINSSASPITVNFGTPVTIFNLSGIALAFFNFYAVDTTNNSNLQNTGTFATCYYNGTNLKGGGGILNLTLSGTNLQLNNAGSLGNLTNVFWTLQFIRIQT